MSLECDYTAERLARIDGMLKDTKQTVATMRSDRLLARQLINELDAMLSELTVPTLKFDRRKTGGG